jgi:hypothetical protein
MKKIILASAILFGSVLFSAAFAQDQEQEGVDVDKVIAMCEEQFSVETYSDENERNRLIDECIENQLNTGKPQSDEG